jgi:hypothetical protein
MPPSTFFTRPFFKKVKQGKKKRKRKRKRKRKER